jgi:hypothetical protein
MNEAILLVGQTLNWCGIAGDNPNLSTAQAAAKTPLNAS